MKLLNHDWDQIDHWIVRCRRCGLDARDFENLIGQQLCTDEEET
jgi:hypothetical protein